MCPSPPPSTWKKKTGDITSCSQLHPSRERGSGILPDEQSCLSRRRAALPAGKSNAAGTEACPTHQAVSSAQERLPESTVGPAAHRPAEEVSLAASGAAGCGL